ncbi:MAG TPA: hypothetical protein VFE54_07245 [Mucilaginibacter sp.]|jgi:hypothetical protein|nr:hypothetical protein [Mucilaginibacter sp.]
MKNFIVPLIALIIGFGAGYLIHQNKPGKAVKFGPGSYEKSHSFTSQPIDSALAAKNIADYQSMVNSGDGGLTGTQGPFYGFYIDAGPLRTMLTKDTTLVGVSFYIGMDPIPTSASDNEVTVYYTGAKNMLKPPPRFQNSPDVYEYVLPCPTACGTLAPSQK